MSGRFSDKEMRGTDSLLIIQTIKYDFRYRRINKFRTFVDSQRQRFDGQSDCLLKGVQRKTGLLFVDIDLLNEYELINKIKTMELASKYNPADVEGKWYQYWLDNKLFSSKPDGREPYTVVIPPPNVTGVLHMGHMLNNTIQDILVRRARMMGKNACWVPGTDHASIATEAKVVNKLAQQGIKKTDLTREEFLKHAWAWTEVLGGIILKQLRKLGASCDWDRTTFTMDEERSKSVI